MRLVDADDLKQEFAAYFNGTSIPIPTMLIHISTVFNMIDFAPTIDQTKHGKWEGKGDPMTWTCSNCGYHVFTYNNTPYCPNCGARMDGKEA